MTYVNITNPFIFGILAGLLFAYLIYMMIRKRKGLRPGVVDREPEI